MAQVLIVGSFFASLFVEHLDAFSYGLVGKFRGIFGRFLSVLGNVDFFKILGEFYSCSIPLRVDFGTFGVVGLSFFRRFEMIWLLLFVMAFFIINIFFLGTLIFG